MDLTIIIPNAISAAVSATAIGISAYWSRRTALEVASRTTKMALELKRGEVTQSLINRWFSADFSKIRAQAHVTILEMVPELSDRSMIDNLVNLPLHQRPAPPPPDQSGLRPSQSITIVLYYFTELIAYKDLGLLDEAVFRKVFISLWEFWSPELNFICKLYKERAEKMSGLVTPPWIEAIAQMDAWMARR